ncbi:flagellar biosynthesis repressor FlbT [uncultured Erythrobacter sp.]|uniref:flagellar biosynthesis repressor FlbT n=1 Tax=uncultured Erythrobacter sp. TaxID=263913 RepID=UPI00261F4703|nr:flagellar biosynthesis repressor FlbT [uncultured Erythrobacter sp.]
MKARDHAPEPQRINLSQGGQAVINGALVTATTACTLEIGSGGNVLTGRSLWRQSGSERAPRDELYYSMLEASMSKARFEEERFRLFRLLSQVVAQDRSHTAQKECSLCASALISGRIEEATQSAARLASTRSGMRAKIPGKRGGAHALRQEIAQLPAHPDG